MKLFLKLYLSFALIGISLLDDRPVLSQESDRPVLHNIFIAKGLGKIVEIYDKGEGPVLLLIEDPHAVLEAQLNIQKFLETVFRKWGVWSPKAILLEGASEGVDTSYFEGVSPKIRKEILQILMKQGEISGAEIFALNHPSRPKLWGIEDSDLYRANLEAFKKTVQVREMNLNRLSEMKRLWLDSLGLQQRNFFQEWDGFENGKVSLKDFLRTLLPLAKNFGILISKGSELDHLLDVHEAMETLNPSFVQSQMNEIIKEVTFRTSKSKLEKWLKRVLDYRLQRISEGEFTEALYQEIRRVGLTPNSYSDFLKFRKVMKKLERMDFSLLYQEIQNLAEKVGFCLFRDGGDSTKKLNQWLEVLSWERLTRLEGNRTDFTNLSKNAPNYLSPAIRFYQLAIQRDKSLARNALEYLKRSHSKSLVLVAGGFHREGLTQIFKDLGISYIVIRPRISKNSNFQHYEDLILGSSLKFFQFLNPSLRLAVPSRLMNALSRIEDIQRFNVLLALYHKICSASVDIELKNEAGAFYHREKLRWIKQLKKLSAHLDQERLSPEEKGLRKRGLEHLIEAIRFYDLDLQQAMRVKESLFVPVRLKGEMSKKPLWVEYSPKEESRGPRDFEELTEVLEQEELTHHTIRFVRGPRVKVDLAELIAGLLSGRNKDLDGLIENFWEGGIIQQLEPSPEKIAYWEKLISEFAKEVFPQKDRPIVELLSNAITSVWKRGEKVPQKAEAYIDQNGFQVVDAGAGMSLREILSKLLIPGLSGTRGTEGIGQFGVGFFSVLRYLTRENDRVTVSTNDGKSAHRVEFFLKEKRFQVQISPLPASSVPQGTQVYVELPDRNFFDAAFLEMTAKEAFQFMQRGKIIINGRVVNQRTLDFEEYLTLEPVMISKEKFLEDVGQDETLWDQLLEKGYFNSRGEIQPRFNGNQKDFLNDMHSKLGNKTLRVFKILKKAQIGQSFFSKTMAMGAETPGRGKVYIVKDDVVLFSMETQGWAIPEALVIRVPKFIKIPIERDKIAIGSRERIFFRSLIDSLAEHPNGISLLSAFYPLVARLQEWNPSPEKEEDLLQYFRQKVRAGLLKTDAVLPDQPGFYQVYVSKGEYLHPDLFTWFEDSGVKLPPFQPFGEFRPKDWKKRIFLAPFRDPMQGVVKFGRLVLINEHLKPNSLLEKALVYTLLNYHVTDPEKNIPGTFLERTIQQLLRTPQISWNEIPGQGESSALPQVANVTGSQLPPGKLNRLKDVLGKLLRSGNAGGGTEQQHFKENRRLLKVILRSLLSLGSARMALSGMALNQEPEFWTSMLEELALNLDQIMVASEVTHGEISLQPFLKGNLKENLPMKKEDLESYLKEIFQIFHHRGSKSMREIVYQGPFAGPISQWGFVQVGKIAVDEKGAVYAFDSHIGDIVRFRDSKFPQVIMLQLQENTRWQDIEVSADGSEFYLALGSRGLLIIDAVGKFKSRINTVPLGERIPARTNIQKIARVDEHVLLLWDKERKAVLVYQRADALSSWEFVRIIQTDLYSVQGMAGDAWGNVFLLGETFGLKKIYIYDPLGKMLFSFKLDEKLLRKPIDLKVDREGRVWVLDELEGIFQYSPYGDLLGRFGKVNLPPNFWGRPLSMTLQSDGTLLMADAERNQIYRFKVRPSDAMTPLPEKTRLNYLFDLTLIGFLEAYLKENQRGYFFPFSIGSLFKDSGRWALVQSWFDSRYLDFSMARWTLRAQRSLDVLYQMFLEDLSQVYFNSSSNESDVRWVQNLSQLIKASPLSGLFHPEDFRFWSVYHRIWSVLREDAARHRFHQFFAQTLLKLDIENFLTTLKFLEAISVFLNTSEGPTLFSVEQNFHLFQTWLEKISKEIFIQIPDQAFRILDGQLFSSMQFMMDKEAEVGTLQMGELALVYFMGAQAIAASNTKLKLDQKKYLEIWDEWIDVPLYELKKDFKNVREGKPISIERDSHLYYLTHDDLDLDKLEETRPLPSIVNSPLLAQENFGLARFYAHFLEASEEERERLMETEIHLQGLRALEVPVQNSLSLETAQSLLRNSINEQSVDAYVFIRELIQNSLDASRNAAAFVIVNAIQEKDLELDWTLPEVRQRIDYKVRQWIEHFRKRPKAFIEEISESSLESSQNAFAFGMVGSILTQRLSKDWREADTLEEAVATLRKWVQEFERDPNNAIDELLALAADEAMARLLIQRAQAAGMELNLSDPLELRLQLVKLVHLEELEERFKLAQLPNIARLADAMRRKYIEVELFKSSGGELVMSFDDAVGMDLQQILKFLLVPGMSSKPTRDPHADGRFGIGFLTALKEASEVKVISSRGRELVEIDFYPSRDEEETVVDVMIQISVKKNPDRFRGTRVLWKSQTRKFHLVSAHLRSKVNEYAGTVSSSEMVVRWQRRVVNEPLTEIGKKDIRGLGTLSWYTSSQKRNVLTRRGMKVKALNMDVDIFGQTPRKIAESVLKTGVVIELPRRTPLTRSRDDIASKERFLDFLQKANAAIALEVAMRSFLEGTSQLALEMLPHDYLKGLIKDRRYEPKDPQVLQDARAMAQGKLVDFRPYVQESGPQQYRFDAGQKLIQLITVLPIVEHPEEGDPLSLLDLINRVDQGEGKCDEDFLGKLSNRALAKSIREAFGEVRQQKLKIDAAAKLLSRPEAAIQNLVLPAQPLRGFDSYWAFHHWAFNVAQLLWSSLQRTGQIEILYRIEDSGNYAYGGNGVIIFNLFAAAKDIEQLGRFLRGEVLESHIIPVFREFLDTIAHEIAHSIQPVGKGTHHEEFYWIVKGLILQLFSLRNTLQESLDHLRKAGYKGEYRDPSQLEPFLIVSNRGPMVLNWKWGYPSSWEKNLRTLMRVFFKSLNESQKLNQVFRRLTINVPKEGRNPVINFGSVQEVLVFLDQNPHYESMMAKEFQHILNGESSSEIDSLLAEFTLPLAALPVRNIHEYDRASWDSIDRAA